MDPCTPMAPGGAPPCRHVLRWLGLGILTACGLLLLITVIAIGSQRSEADPGGDEETAVAWSEAADSPLPVLTQPAHRIPVPAPPGSPQRAAAPAFAPGLQLRAVGGVPIDAYAAHIFDVALHAYARRTDDADKLAACLRAQQRLQRAWQEHRTVAATAATASASTLSTTSTATKPEDHRR